MSESAKEVLAALALVAMLVLGLLVLALSGCGGRVEYEQAEEAARHEPGSLGGYCSGHWDCTGTPRFMSCRESTCRAYCELDVNPERGEPVGLADNCAAMGGVCKEDGECRR